MTVYMIDGTAYGPRASINKIMNRSEFDNPEIYCFKIR